MGLRIGKAPFRLSEYTNQDSESNAMLKVHAYRAQTAGYASALCATLQNGQAIKLYVGLTSDPFGAGTLIDSGEGACDFDRPFKVSGLVAKGEYFEVTCTDTPTILWKSVGTLIKPIDYD